MLFDHYTFIHPKNVDPTAFFNLVNRNREHLKTGFPYTVRACKNLEKTKSFIQKAISTQERKKGYHFYILDTVQHKLIGFINIKNINRKIPMCELGYFIDENFQGKGIISKGVAVIVKFCFEQMKMNKIFICTDPFNMASQQVALKNGFVKEGILRNEFKAPDGTVHDVIYFGLLKEDFKP
jgi:ribosomal-protein-serine acetyltransferase